MYSELTKASTYDEEMLMKKLARRRGLEEGFLKEAQIVIDNPKESINCSQLYNYSNLKRILFNHCSTYKLLFNPDDYMIFKKKPFVKSVTELCAHIKVPPPEFSEDNVKEKIFILSQYLAVPYMLLTSPLRDAEQKMETTIVFHDMFDNMYEQANYYRTTIQDKANKRVVLFHYPGQAYTFYQEGLAYNNSFIAGLVDSFFYHLEAKGYVNFEEDRIKFIGFGYGGNILLYYCRFK